MITLEQLFKLKNSIDNEPKLAITTRAESVGVNRLYVNFLSSNGLIKNVGNKRHPYWKWDAPLPNVLMTKKINDEYNKMFLNYRLTREAKAKAKVVKAAKVVDAVKPTFVDAIASLGIEIKISNDASVRLGNDRAWIKRNGVEVEFDSVSNFKNILDLIK